MPVPAQIGSLVWDNNDVTNTSLDDGFTAGTGVLLARLVRLDWLHHLVGELAEKINHVGRVGGFDCHRRPWYVEIPHIR